MVKKKTAKKKKAPKKKSPALKMTPKQKIFADFYLTKAKKNGTEAAILAGYSKKTACEMASQNLRKLHIQEYIREALDKQSKRTEITADNVLKEVAKLAFSNIQHLISVHNGQAYIDLTELTDDQWACISSVSTDTQSFRVNKKGKKSPTCVNEEDDVEDDDKEVVKTKVTLWDKKGSLDMLMKHLNQYQEDNESGASSITIMNDIEIDGKPFILKVGKKPEED